MGLRGVFERVFSYSQVGVEERGKGGWGGLSEVSMLLELERLMHGLGGFGDAFRRLFRYGSVW